MWRWLENQTHQKDYTSSNSNNNNNNNKSKGKAASAYGSAAPWVICSTDTRLQLSNSNKVHLIVLLALFAVSHMTWSPSTYHRSKLVHTFSSMLPAHNMFPAYYALTLILQEILTNPSPVAPTHRTYKLTLTHSCSFTSWHLEILVHVFILHIKWVRVYKRDLQMHTVISTCILIGKIQSYERPRFERVGKGNSEMAYCLTVVSKNWQTTNSSWK